MRGANRITKDQFYRGGGFSNPRLYRRMSGGRWTYWETYL